MSRRVPCTAGNVPDLCVYLFCFDGSLLRPRQKGVPWCSAAQGVVITQHMALASSVLWLSLPIATTICILQHKCQQANPFPLMHRL